MLLDVGGVADTDLGSAASVDLHLAPRDQASVGAGIALVLVLDLDLSGPEDPAHHVPVEETVTGTVERRIVAPELKGPVHGQKTEAPGCRNRQGDHRPQDDPPHCHPCTSPRIS